MKVRHVDLHPDEFLAAVAGEMSPAELGVYWMVCLLIYARGEAIEKNVEWLRGKFRRNKGNNVIADALDALIMSGRVTQDGSKITVRRCEDELKMTRRRIQDASKSGKRGGRPRSKINKIEKGAGFSDQKGTEKLTTNHQPPTTNHQVREDANASSETRARRSGNGRKTRIAADWQPDSQDRGYAEARGWPWDRIDEQAAAFRDRCTRDEPRYADWHAAWRTWVRNADKFDARDSRAFNGSGSRQSRSGSIAEAARNVLSRLDLD